MKKILLLCSVLFLSIAPIFAQQITRFAVVDTSRVYSAYFRDSSAVRNYEKKKADFQKEINRLTDELKNLQVQKTNADNAENTTASLRLEADIEKKATYLTEYTRAKNIELESLRKRLENSNDFYKKLYDIIDKIAETDGYSMVMSLQNSNSILWYSPTVDITDKVIAAVGSGN